MSTVNFKSVEVNEATGSNDLVFSGSSSLNVLALRGLIDARYIIGMWSIGLGTDLEIPLVELSKNTTIDDEVSEDELAEFEDTLGHTKSSLRPRLSHRRGRNILNYYSESMSSRTCFFDSSH